MECQLHLLKYSDYNIVYHPDSTSFFKVTDEEKNLIYQTELKSDPFNFQINTNVDTSKYDELCKKLLSNMGNLNIDKNSNDIETELKPRLSKLVLLVSNGCNMGCKYCSLDNLNQSNIYMSSETACKAVKVFIDEYAGNINSIMFFGGEPLINFKVIKDVVEYTLDYCNKKNYNSPKFGIQTNGTLINSDVCSFFKKHNFFITISLDGESNVNDLQRVFLDGRGSHKEIIKVINNLIENDVAFNIEATITKNHVDMGVSVKDVFDYLIELGAHSVHIMPVIGSHFNLDLSANIENIAMGFAQCAAYSMESLTTNHHKRLYSTIYVIENLIYGSRNNICYAGTGSMTVNVDGNIYPCYYLLSDYFLMGNVFDGNLSNSNFFKIQNKLLMNNKSSIWPCKNCWAKNLCNSCYGSNPPVKDKLLAPSFNLCIIQREIIDAVISKFIEIKTDTEKWNQFIGERNTA